MSVLTQKSRMEEGSIEDVGKWGYDTIMKWLNDENVSSEGLQSLDQLRDLIRAVMNKKQTHDSEVFHKLHVEMENAFAKNTHMKGEMLRIYDASIAIYGRMPDDIKRSIQAIYGGNIEQKISENKEDFSNKQCSIVVTGETSAGKSSFINLLLGKMALPSSALSTTKHICHIHSLPDGSPWYFEVTMADGLCKVHNKYGNNEDMIKDLKELVTRDDISLQKVDIYLHIPLLGDNTHVTIVDSPGIGDKQELSEKLLKYLPNASALIFIINSSNCGGVQGDKLGTIFSILNREIKDKKLFSFDPKCTMFILNKWDILEKEKINEPDLENNVWQNTLEKLTENLTGFSWETCMYKMSITEAIAYRDRGMVTDKYRCMFTSLKRLVASSMSVDARRHCRWLTEFHEHMRKYLAIRVCDTNSNYEETDKKYKEANLYLSKLRKDVDSIREYMELKCTKICLEMAAKMHDHIHSLDVQAKLKKRIKMVIAPHEELMKASVLNQINDMVAEEVKDLEKREQMIAKAKEDLRMEINENYHILIEKLVDVERSIENKKSEDERGFSIGEKVLIGVGLTIGIPVVVALSIALVPITIPVSIGLMIKRTTAIKREMENQEEIKDEFLQICLQEHDENVFKKYVDKKYLPQLQQMLDHISKEIPSEIEGLQKLVKDMQENRLSLKEVRHTYEPALESVQKMAVTLHELNLTHISECYIDVERVRITKKISTSDSLTVYSASICSGDEESEGVITLLPDAPTEAYLKTVEVLSILGKTYHKNMVAFIGFCYTNRLPAIASEGAIEIPGQFSNPRLMTIFETCGSTLEDYLLEHKDVQCGNPNKTSQKRGLEFFCTTGQSICEGMLYMHDQGFLFRCIKLNNVMIRDGHVKINPPLIGSLANYQREWPTAPELATGQYTKETDVFYVGKLLWELWYGRNASGHTGGSTEGYKTFPDCKLGRAMPEKLAQIVRKCLEADPKKRPSLGDVIAVLVLLK